MITSNGPKGARSGVRRREQVCGKAAVVGSGMNVGQATAANKVGREACTPRWMAVEQGIQSKRQARIVEKGCRDWNAEQVGRVWGRKGLVVVGSASAARDDVGDDRERHSDKSGPGEPESVAVVKHNTVLSVVDRVLGLDVNSGQ